MPRQLINTPARNCSFFTSVPHTSLNFLLSHLGTQNEARVPFLPLQYSLVGAHIVAGAFVLISRWLRPPEWCKVPFLHRFPRSFTDTTIAIEEPSLPSVSVYTERMAVAVDVEAASVNKQDVMNI